MSAPAGDPELPSRRVAAVGVSLPGPCGVRDHAELLAAGLAEQGWECSMHWLAREDEGFGATRRRVRAWLAELDRELRERRPDALLLHYAIFPLSWRGLPLFVRPLLRVLRRQRVPLAIELHEHAYPWHLGGARGKVWAASHRAVLIDAVRTADALGVTVDFRGDWLRSRRWLPRRPISVIPVFSNLPETSAVEPVPNRIGMFGFAHEGIEGSVVLDAMARLLGAGGEKPELLLLGAPGGDSQDGRRWVQEAGERSLPAPSFTGFLPAGELARALAECELLLSADRIGPTSRRTTLAASLASGRPLVAVDGRRTWSELGEEGAALIVPPSGAALADALQQLRADPEARERLGARGREFARRRMSLQSNSRLVAELLEAAGAPGP
jgi:glycosyltransferase involved in cell wall biosynthesis